MDSIKNQARTAAVLYLLACLPAPFALLYVPSTLIVPGNATATADHVRAFPLLLRFGIAGELINACLIIFAVIALYRLFRPTGRSLAQAMAALMLVSIPVSLLNLVNDLAALILVSGADFLAPFSRAQLDSLAYMFIRLHSQGLYVAQIFWGLWLFPYGLLAIRSGFIPRWVGIALMVAGYGYVANSFTALFLPKLVHIVSPLTTALEIGEVPIIVWLFLVGSREEAPRMRASEPVGAAG